MHDEKMTNRHSTYGWLDALGNLEVQLGARLPDFTQDRYGCRRQSQPPCATVARITAPSGQAHFFKAVDQTRDRDWGNLGNGREFILRDVRLPLEAGQDDHLRPRHAFLARELVCICAHMPRDIVELDQ
jgi:hypothetical protein